MIKVNGEIIEQNHFPDGTLLLKQEPEIFEMQTIEWFFENNEELVTLIFLTKHLRERGVENLILYMPYLV
jgi:ribose-phosphate pyrophosphokinase